MNHTEPLKVSVIEPLAPAIERVKTILFKPFDLGKWFAIGFCAWLAMLGEGGGFGMNFPGNAEDLKRQVPRIQEVISPYMALITIGAVVLAVIFLAIGIVLLWLRCRGRFMFLNSVAKNTSQVTAPWHEFRKEANSLFWFLLVFGILSFIIMAAVAGAIALVLFIVGVGGCAWVPAILIAVAIGLFIFLPLMVAIIIVCKFTVDFVVPIMYISRTGWRQAWAQLWQLLGGNKGRFALYILFNIALSMAIGTLVLAVICVTCCIACCLMVIPYIGTVLLLPVLAFSRSYSLYYLAQYGPQFDVFSHQPQTADIASSSL
jgi:hypothetical protein